MPLRVQLTGTPWTSPNSVPTGKHSGSIVHLESFVMCIMRVVAHASSHAVVAVRIARFQVSMHVVVSRFEIDQAEGGLAFFQMKISFRAQVVGPEQPARKF
jgi:hypothetical protein